MADEENFFKEDSAAIRKPSKTPWVLLFLVLIGAGAIVYFGYAQLESERAAAEAARKASDEASAKAQAAEGARKALEDRLAKLEEDNARLTSDRDSLAQQVQEKDSELQKLKATYDSLEDKMKAEIKKGEIRLSQAGGRIKVDLVDKILFDSGSADVAKRGEDVLARIGSVLAKVEDKQIQVSGHTDDSPIVDKALKDKFATNWELSSARAVNVVRFLSEKAGVPPKRLVAAGYGQFHPIATNANPQGRALNRRIEILLTPSLDAKATNVAKADPKPAAKPDPKAAKKPATAPAAKKSAKR